MIVELACIYELEICGKRYIGSTKNLNKRLACHRSKTYAKWDKTSMSSKLYNWIRECDDDQDWKCVRCSVLETFDISGVNAIEKGRLYRSAENRYIATHRPELNATQFAVLDSDAKSSDAYKGRSVSRMCECGGKFQPVQRYRHLCTLKHMKYEHKKRLTLVLRDAMYESRNRRYVFFD